MAAFGGVPWFCDLCGSFLACGVECASAQIADDGVVIVIDVDVIGACAPMFPWIWNHFSELWLWFHLSLWAFCHQPGSSTLSGRENKHIQVGHYLKHLSKFVFL